MQTRAFFFPYLIPYLFFTYSIQRYTCGVGIAKMAGGARPLRWSHRVQGRAASPVILVVA